MKGKRENGPGGPFSRLRTSGRFITFLEKEKERSAGGVLRSYFAFLLHSQVVNRGVILRHSSKKEPFLFRLHVP
jgi:hypothetical protein